MNKQKKKIFIGTVLAGVLFSQAATTVNVLANVSQTGQVSSEEKTDSDLLPNGHKKTSKGVTSFKDPYEDPLYPSEEGWISYYVNERNTITISGVGGPRVVEVDIPETLDGLPVTTIGKRAFGYHSPDRIKLPYISTIEEEAFAHNTSITRIEINARTIGARAFNQCTNLQYVSFGVNGVESIGEEAFNNTKIETITLPRTVLSIGKMAFASLYLENISVAQDNPNYTSVGGVLFDKKQKMLLFYPQGKIGVSYSVPNSVTTIGENAFYQALYLKNVALGTSVRTIKTWAFGYAEGLKSITKGNVLETIEHAAFYSASKLSGVEVGNALQTIDSWAFYNTNILDITLPNSLTFIGNSAFEEVEHFTIHAYENSYGHAYAKVNDILFQALPGASPAPVAPAPVSPKPTNTSYSVTFKSSDGKVLSTQSVARGNSAKAPSAPARKDYTFQGWDKSFNNITTHLTVTAKHKAIPVTFKTNVTSKTIGKKKAHTLSVKSLNVAKSRTEHTIDKKYSKLATVNKTTGKVTTKDKAGTFKVKVKVFAKNGTTATKTITYKTIHHVTDVLTTKGKKLSTKASVKKGKTVKLPALKVISMKKTIKATKPKTTYKTSNKKVVTVDSKGKIKGLKKGKATITITITTADGAKVTKKITVTVK